jgi:hypothetical protein
MDFDSSILRALPFRGIADVLGPIIKLRVLVEEHDHIDRIVVAKLENRPMIAAND